MSVTDRGHLSIGEVLALLQGEFPDVTISKIRFLESQGLIDPERTPSGYRKFYDADIARLRWILIQQRDHFLPLKVIKDRLDEVGTPGDLPEEPPTATTEPDRPSNGAAGGHVGAPVPDVVDGAALQGDATPIASGTASERAPAGDEAPARGPASDARLPLPFDEAPPEGADSSPRQPPAEQDAPATVTADAAGADAAGADVAGAEEPRTAAAAAEAVDVALSLVDETMTAPAPPPAADAADGTEGPEEIDVAGTTGDPPDEVAADEGEAGSRDSSGSGRGGRGAGGAGRTRSPGRRRAVVDVTSASFTIDELAAACETTVAGVEELERFGLISSRPVTGGRRYGDDALIVTKLAQRFAQFGIEARHLRMFRVAVDRELALYDQVIAPIARGRSDSGDVRASEIWAELDGLGAELRDALFHRGPT